MVIMGERKFYIDVRLSQLATNLSEKFIKLCNEFAKENGLEYSDGILDNHYKWIIIQENREEKENEGC